MHNREYYTYPENVKRDWVQQDLDAYVRRETYGEGGHGLPGSIRWIENTPVSENEDTARDLIRHYDRGNYDQLAVRYYKPERIESKAALELSRKLRAAYDEYTKRNNEVWVAGIKAEFVSCRNCGSKLCREYIKGNRCPVCFGDLRPASMLKSVEAAKAKFQKARLAEEKYIAAHSKKKVMWMVKIEYHT